jgi:tetratricopeptide (TPR) repeat protein
MGLIRTFRFSLKAFFFLFAVFSLNAQNTAGVASLAAELEKLEQPQVNPAHKHDALARLARLSQLSGNREKAAQTWSEATGADPARKDDSALLEASRLYLSLGEYEKAEAGIHALLSGSRNEEALLLDAQLAAFQTGDLQALTRLAAAPAWASWRSGIYYTLWKISGAQTWKTKLLAEYPQSPEARIARGSPNTAAAATPQWLLFPGREPPALPASPPAAASTGFLQAGLFSREENARALADRLAGAGFRPQLTHRQASGGEYWAVTVPGGADINRTLRELKNAGFESFPINE